VNLLGKLLNKPTDKISEVSAHARGQIAKSVNTELIQTYWLIDQYV